MVSQAAYADLEIRILERQAQGYLVEMTLNETRVRDADQPQLEAIQGAAG